MTKKELKERLSDSICLLNVPGVGRTKFSNLIKKFGSASVALAAPISALTEVSRISRTIASSIKKDADPDSAREIASRIIQLGWEVFFKDEPGYPLPLAQIRSAPPILFGLGKSPEEDEKIIAIVGTRTASEKGKLFTYNLASALAEKGVTVISGMADGIDSSAHRGSLDSGGRTIAIWGTSLDIIYPASNKQLANKIREHGCILSEYLPGKNPDKSSFPERNRIISALSSGVVVVEASKKSGALITVRHAMDQGKEIFAVPGFPTSNNSAGTNELIKCGAKLLTNVDDIFDELPALKGKVISTRHKARTDITDTEREIIDIFTTSPIQIDYISRTVNLPISELMEFMLALELKGVVKEISGKRFVLTEQNL